MRVFVGLDIDEEIRGRISAFVAEVRGLVREVRWVGLESLHVTLKFVGEKPDAAVAEIEKALGSVTVESFEISFRGYGFFPTEKAARVFWVGIEGQPRAGGVWRAKSRRSGGDWHSEEKRGFSSHLTLARGGARIGSGSGAPGRRTGDRINQRFAKLQERLKERPALEFGTMAAREFFLYRSQLSPKGSQYTKIARFGLK